MLEEVSKRWRRKGPSIGVVVTITVLLVTGVLACYTWWAYENRTTGHIVLTDEAIQYLSLLQMSDIHMGAKESFLGHTIVSIDGKIGNLGDRTVRVVEVNCVFRGLHLSELGRQAAVIVGPRSGALSPGQTRPFRIAFDAVPQEWNQNMPNLYVAQILFE